jgi:chromosome segregation ATPase
MTTPRIIPSVLLFACAAASGGLIATGCAHKGYMRASATSDTLGSAANEVETAQHQLDDTTNALNAVMNAPAADLRSSFEHFRMSLESLDSTVGQIKMRATQMDEQGDKYFRTWDARLGEMQNEAIRERSEARQREVSEQFTQLKQEYLVARREFDPLMSKLHDVRSLLSVDLTPAGVSSARDVSVSITSDAKIARQSLDKLGESFRSLSAKLDPAGAAATNGK